MRTARHICLLLILLLTAVVSCSKQLTVEQQVIAVIREMETRIEDGERRPFMSHVSGDFSGQDGRVTHDELRAMVLLQLNRHQRLHAQLFPIRVTADSEESAKATFRALITGGPGWLPDSGQVYDFETQWSKQSGDWMLHSANWTPVPLDEVL